MSDNLKQLEKKVKNFREIEMQRILKKYAKFEYVEETDNYILTSYVFKKDNTPFITRVLNK